MTDGPLILCTPTKQAIGALVETANDPHGTHVEAFRGRVVREATRQEYIDSVVAYGGSWFAAIETADRAFETIYFYEVAAD